MSAEDESAFLHRGSVHYGCKSATRDTVPLASLIHTKKLSPLVMMIATVEKWESNAGLTRLQEPALYNKRLQEPNVTMNAIIDCEVYEEKKHIQRKSSLMERVPQIGEVQRHEMDLISKKDEQDPIQLIESRDDYK